MSDNYPLQTISRAAGGAINPHRILRHGTAPGFVLQASGAGQPFMGVSSSVGAATNQALDVHTIGIVPVEYGDDVTAGDALTSDATGRAVPAAADERHVGFATEDGAVGTIGSVQLQLGIVGPTGAQGAQGAQGPQGAPG